MTDKALDNDVPSRPAVVSPVARSTRSVSVEERRRLVAESLQVGNPGNNARDLPDRADPRVECQIELAVDDIRPYENNPRRAGNAKFADIKESIRTSGVRNPLTVTRRPGEAHFIVEAGGNTRLIAIQQLWSETGDPRFRKLLVLFRPWRSESHVLTSHLIENEQRGEMTFWDKAAGIVTLKARLETEKEQVLSLRQLEEELRGLGLSVNIATLAHYLFATERLRTLGEAIPELSGLDVKTIQPRLNAIKRYAQSCASMPEEHLYAAVFEPVFRRIAIDYPETRTFSAATVCEACEEALARQLDESVEQLRRAVESSCQSPQGSAAVSAPPPAVITPTLSASADASVSTANMAPSGQAGRVRAAPTRADAPGRATASGQLAERVLALAATAGIDNCVRLHQAAPFGYYLEPLPSSDSEVPDRQRAWCLLAGVSGQLDDASPTLPLDRAFFSWLTDASDEGASAFWNILSLARASRAARHQAPVANTSTQTQEDA